MSTSFPSPYTYNTGGGAERQRKNIGNRVNYVSGEETQQNKQRGSEFSTLMPQYKSLLNSGYSPQEKSGIEQGTLGAIQGAYGGAADAASRRMARTNNT